MAAKSEREGRPVYEKRDFIKIIQPGERDVIDREVNDFDKMRFQRQWAAYQAQQEQVPDGTPIAILYPHDPDICDTLRALKVHTIEQLGGMTEQGISRLGLGGRNYVERAKAFLQAASGMKGAHKLQRQVDEANDKIAALEATIRQLQEARQSADAKGT